MQQRSYIKHNKKRITDKLSYVLPAVALLMIAGLWTAKYLLRDNASATLTPTTTASTTFGVMSDLSLGVTLDGETIMRIVPDANGNFAQTDIGITVNTSNTFGYTLTMYAYEPNTTTPTTSLTNVAASLSGSDHPTIATLDSGSSYTEQEFKDSTDTKNKWGYKVNGSDKFTPVTSTTNLVGSDKNGSKREEITFGAKIDNTIPNGYYQATLNFVAVTNTPTAADERSTFETAFAYAGISLYDGEHYAMQDISKPICSYVYYDANDKTGAKVKSIQLVDKRDGKLYWVSKLADGNCWMTQNLDFNIDGTRLDSTTTNLVAYGEAPYTDEQGYSQSSGITYWTPDATAKTIITSRDLTGPDGQINYGANAGKWVQDANKPYSVDPGQWYMTNEYFSSSVCNDVSYSVGCNFLNGSKTTAHDGETPLSKYFSENAYAGNGEHGSVGNWYNWTAAIATNDSSSVQDANTYKNSLCPAKWGLPEDGKYSVLNNLYNASYSSTADAKDTGLLAAPFYAVRGGAIDVGASSLATLYAAGRGGRYWSSASVAGGTNARFLSFDSTGVYPSYSYDRHDGFSLRCVAL